MNSKTADQNEEIPSPFVIRVTRIGRAIQRVEEILLSASILIIAGLTILNVFCRSVLGFSLAVTEEVSQFCIIIVSFVGLSYAASKGRHIRMTAIYDQLGPKMRKAAMILITGSTSLIMLLLCFYAISYVVSVQQLGHVYPVLRVPFYLIYSIAPIGLLLAGIHYGLAAFRNLISPDVYLSFDVKDEYEDVIVEEI